MRCPLLLPFVVLTACQSFAVGAESEPQMAITVYNQDGSPAGIVQGKVVARDGEFSTVRLPDAVKRAEVQAAPQASTQPPEPSASVDPPVAPVGDQTLLKQKTAELERLRAEVDQLREATETAQTIMVSVEVLDVSLTKMRKLGIEIPPQALGVVPADAAAKGSLNELIAALKKNNVARTLANPTLMTLSGQAASLFAGQRIPLPAAPDSDAAVEYAEAGIRLDALAESLGGRRVRLDLRPRISSVSEPGPVGAGGVEAPRIKVWQCATSCELTFGETIILPGLVEERLESVTRDDGRVTEQANEVATWVVVRAEDASGAANREVRVHAASHETPLK